MDLQKRAVLKKHEREIVRLLGNRWWKMGIKDILDENGVIFRLAVAIVGTKMNRDIKIRRQQ
jgi:hypothetical protein